jgi:REP element-mobilizing transposase RayT
MRNLEKGRAALRRGRVSIPHAEYFLTLCTDQRRAGLTEAAVAPAILVEMHAMEADFAWQLRCAVVMPDHMHLLMILGNTLTLGQCVGRLKARTGAMLRLAPAPLAWERDFFDRHVRPDDERLAIFLYVFLNPHRAGLCARGESWPWYFCRDEDWAWFKGLLDADRPYPEWLVADR